MCPLLLYVLRYCILDHARPRSFAASVPPKRPVLGSARFCCAPAAADACAFCCCCFWRLRGLPSSSMAAAADALEPCCDACCASRTAFSLASIAFLHSVPSPRFLPTSFLCDLDVPKSTCSSQSPAKVSMNALSVSGTYSLGLTTLRANEAVARDAQEIKP